MISKGLVRVHRSALPRQARDEIPKHLTVYPLATSSFQGTPDPIRLFEIDGDWLGVPRGYYTCYLKKRFDCEGTFDYSIGRSELKPTTPITPRGNQEELIGKAIDTCRLHEFGGAIIEATMAAGKTPCGLECARRLGRKTLVVVSTTVLMEQWKKEIQKFFPEWSIGTVQADDIDIKDRDVCVGMIHTLSMKENLPEMIFDEFGTMLIDECHVAGAAEFQKTMFRFRTQYIIGLSGTLERADRAENVFKYGIGRTVSSTAKAPTLNPTIYFVDTKYVWAPRYQMARELEKHKYLDAIITDQARNQVIINNVVQATTKGRHVLVLTERVNHVEYLYRSLVQALIPHNITVGMMTGATKLNQREIAATAQVLVATVQLLGTGFNNPRLDTLIFASPVQKVEQSAGRVCRLHPDKKPPIVVDLYDSGYRTARIMAMARRKRYARKGWQMVGDQDLQRR